MRFSEELQAASPHESTVEKACGYRCQAVLQSDSVFKASARTRRRTRRADRHWILEDESDADNLVELEAAEWLARLDRADASVETRAPSERWKNCLLAPFRSPLLRLEVTWQSSTASGA